MFSNDNLEVLHDCCLREEKMAWCVWNDLHTSKRDQFYHLKIKTIEMFRSYIEDLLYEKDTEYIVVIEDHHVPRSIPYGIGDSLMP